MSSEVPDKEEVKKASISYAMDWGSKSNFLSLLPFNLSNSTKSSFPPIPITPITMNLSTNALAQNHLTPQPSSQPSSRRSTPAPSNLSPCSSRPSSSSAPTSTSHPTKSTPRASQPHGLGSTSYSHEGGRSLARALVPGLGISLARGD